VGLFAPISPAYVLLSISNAQHSLIRIMAGDNACIWLV
jgi:hypothetical protein